MDIDYTVGEVELSYKPKFKSLHQVSCSEDAYKYLLPTYKEGTICYKEYFLSLIHILKENKIYFTDYNKPVANDRKRRVIIHENN